MIGPGKPFSRIEALSSCVILHCYVSRLLHWHLNQDVFFITTKMIQKPSFLICFFECVCFEGTVMLDENRLKPLSVLTQVCQAHDVGLCESPSSVKAVPCYRETWLLPFLSTWRSPSSFSFWLWSVKFGTTWIPGENGPSADNYLITCRGRGVDNGHQACMPSDMCGLQHETWDLIRGCVGVRWPCKQEAAQYMIKFDLWNKYCCQVSQAGVGISIDSWENWFLQNPNGGHWSQGHDLVPGWSSFPIRASNGGETKSDSSWVCSLPEPRRLSFSVEVETPGS